MSRKYIFPFNPAVCKANRRIDTILMTILIGLVGNVVIIAIVLVMFPRAPFLLGNIIPKENFILPVRIAFTILYLIVFLSINGNLLAVAFIVCIYLLYMTIFVTNEFLMVGIGAQKKQKYKTRNSLRAVRNIMVAYRTTEILHQNFLRTVGILFVPLHALTGNLVIFSNYVVITQSSEMNGWLSAMLFMWSLSAGIFWWAVLEIGRYISTRGSRVLSSWKLGDWGSPLNSKIMLRFGKSCRPLMLNYRSTYVIGRQSSIKFVKGITRGTFRVLLTLKRGSRIGNPCGLKPC
ncbi:unnamed protein product [Orchesella dallaii]|uniref:Uncharacterized protein n=1 Tax=Orchesella dallaii TaxID=48710 RepID=A0ABP1R6A2_9HEXA